MYLYISGCVTDEETLLSDEFFVHADYESEGMNSCDESLSTDQEHWDNDDMAELLKDFDIEDDISTSLRNSNHGSDNALIHLVLLFLFLWSSFYSISATALNHLIQFFHYLFVSISKRSPNSLALSTLFPTSLYKAKNFYNVEKESFEKYIICKKCTILKIALKIKPLVVLLIQKFVCIYLFDIIHIVHAEDLVGANSLRKL